MRIRDGNPAPLLPTVKHKRPCRECPFRREAPRGWLGGGTVDAWKQDLTVGDTAFVCHMAEAENKRHFCAGSMIHYRNSFKTPRNAVFATAVMEYQPDKETVFQWSFEFEAHHRGGPLEEKG